MWARHMEFTLGLWLLISPFVLRHDPSATFHWAHDLLVGTILVVVSLACHWRPLRTAHLGLAAVAFWLMGLGWWQTWISGGIHAAGVHQNWLLVGMLLVMFCIVPSDASTPPRPWRREASE